MVTDATMKMKHLFTTHLILNGVEIFLTSIEIKQFSIRSFIAVPYLNLKIIVASFPIIDLYVEQVRKRARRII